MGLIISQIRILNGSEKLLLYSLVIGISGGFLNALPPEILGFNPTAFGWVLPLTASIGVFFAYSNRVTFPILLWTPWILYTVLCYLNQSAPNAFQRLVMLHAGVIIGAAFSSLSPSLYFYEQFSKYINYYFWFILTIGFATAGVFRGQIEGATGFAAGSITATLRAVWYAGKYAIGEKKAIYYWLMLCLVPFLCNTRTGMIAVALTMPLTFGPLSFKKRFLAVVLMIALGAVAFQSERVQSKMFYSGHGDYIDAFNGLLDLMTGSESEFSSGDFATNGRKSISLALKDGLNNNYWIGNGSNSSEAISMDAGGVSHPHNDWLRIQYEYGMLGLIIFISTVLAQIYRAALKLKGLPKRFFPLFCLGFGAFIPMAIFMASDNILLYIAWFGNLQFAAIGLFYGYVNIYKSNDKYA